MRSSKHRCFISYRGNPSTRDFARRIASSIRRHDLLGQHLEPWFAPDDLRHEPNPDDWLTASREAFFTVFVIDPDFAFSDACLKELQAGLDSQVARRSRPGMDRLRTAFAIRPDHNYVAPVEIRETIYIEDYEAPLLDSMAAQLQSALPSLSGEGRFALTDWPGKLVNADGTLDIAIVVGSTGKEAPLGASPAERRALLDRFKPYLDEHDNPRPQSARVAEFLPYLTSRLERLSRTRMRAIGALDAESAATVPEVYCDRSLLAHFQSVAENRNLVVVGGGDTNLLARYFHRCYRGQLPIYFNDPTDSSELSIDSVMVMNRESGDGPRLTLMSSAEGNQWFSGLIAIRPNPMNQSKFIVWVAGLTALGTQAGLLILADLPQSMYTATYSDTVAFKGDDGGTWRAIGYELL